MNSSGTMPEDLPTPDKSIKQIEHERKNKRKDESYDKETYLVSDYDLCIVLGRHSLCRRLPGQSPFHEIPLYRLPYHQASRKFCPHQLP